MKHFILITVVAVALTGCQRGMTEYEYTSGPFPNELPPGHRIVTNGKKFSFEYCFYPHTNWHRAAFESDTACEAVQVAWRVLEWGRHEKYVPEEPEGDWSAIPAPKSGDWCEVKK